MAKEGGDPRAIIKKICQLVQGPVSAEVVATDAAGMIAEGRELATIDEHVVVKVPFTRDGRQGAARRSSGEGIRVNVTLIFSRDAGAARRQGRRVVRQPVRRPARRHRVGRHGPDPGRSSTIFEQLRLPDRDPRRQRPPSDAHRRRPRAWARDVCTCPAAVIEACFKHPLTDIGLEKFLKDWEKAQAAKV